MERQPLRPIPPAWREQILAAAGEASQLPQLSPSAIDRMWWQRALATLHAQLAAFLWPSPKAWAGLAAVWAVMLGIHLVNREAALPPMTQHSSPPSRQRLQALADQKQMLTELLNLGATPATLESKSVPPRPRSDSGRHDRPA